jgi:TPP-dependent pyruvate/acetoin dehydrogenase alpha subunit
MENHQRVEFLRYMVMAREFDAAMLRLYRQGKAFGGVYSQLGNEAVSVGSAMALDRSQDVLFPMHRNIGAHFVFGANIDQLMQNQLARQGSQMRGTDGTGHYADPALRIYGNVSHLGAMIPVANGFVLAARMRGEQTVALTYIGDGGAQVGEVHEALNFAAVHKLPLVLIIENNQYAYSTPNHMEFAVDELSKRAGGYGMFGETIDGTDVELVYETCVRAVERARAGEGPSIIETVTMRMRGHAEHDDFSYVPKPLLDEWALRDPVNNYAARLVAEGLITGEEVKQLRDETLDAMIAAIDRTLELPWPEAAEGLRNVFL